MANEQLTMTDVEYSNRKRITKKDDFLNKMNSIVPWSEWVSLIQPYYPSGKRGRPVRGILKAAHLCPQLLNIFCINAVCAVGDFCDLIYVISDRKEGEFQIHIFLEIIDLYLSHNSHIPDKHSRLQLHFLCPPFYFLPFIFRKAYILTYFSSHTCLLV